MKRYKKILPIIIGIIIGISTTVGAATIFNSKDITYSSSLTTKKNVKEALDELYSKIGKCPNGMWCYNNPMTIADRVELGDYISMSPTSTKYVISKDLTGYSEDQIINPSELNLWRVIKKNADGSVDVVSEYVSSNEIAFRGKKGWMNLSGTLNTIATQYTNEKYVLRTRHFGTSRDIDFCTDETLESCSKHNYYDEDKTFLVKSILSVKGYTLDGKETTYLSGTRSFDSSVMMHQFPIVTLDGSYSFRGLYDSNKNLEYTSKDHLRPILTLKATINIASGDGKSESTTYQLA